MVSKNNIILLLGAVAVAGALAAGYWSVFRDRPQLCAACHRHINNRSLALVEVSGEVEPVCCVRCGLTVERQEHLTVRLLEVRDYSTGNRLEPDSAYYVRGSRVMLCEHHEALMDPAMRPYDVMFDRCMPSVFAFAREEDAAAFASSNGGSVLRLPQIIEEVKSRQ